MALTRIKPRTPSGQLNTSVMVGKKLSAASLARHSAAGLMTIYIYFEGIIAEGVDQTDFSKVVHFSCAILCSNIFV
ncbi:hypothetical protein ACMYR3_10995 [Ampullimonas aquatilis]|uniref:hypothetical protein n=1 Tax=Ampullimonas aquatilis TaxID=1341549 RepID=UPI003C72D3EB